jgi:hypothetical protein
MTPFGVDTMATPSPFITRGIFATPKYARRLGLDTTEIS